MNCKQEIEDLHEFFVEWFHGRAANDDDAWARFDAALTRSFLLVSPDGSTTPREQLAQSLRELHGCRTGTDFRIWIEEFSKRYHEGPLCLVTYVECQELAGHVSRRQCTALFVEDPEAPCGCRWLHVHETWVAGQGPAA